VVSEIWEGKRIAPAYAESQWICDKWVGYIIVKKDDEPFYTVLSAWLPMNGDELGALGGADKFADAVKLIKHEEQRRRHLAKNREFRAAYSGRGVTGYPFDDYDGSDESFEQLQDQAERVHPGTATAPADGSPSFLLSGHNHGDQQT
jgi:hypothetical protein